VLHLCALIISHNLPSQVQLLPLSLLLFHKQGLLLLLLLLTLVLLQQLLLPVAGQDGVLVPAEHERQCEGC
jgi:hypothetical protein